MPIELVTGQNMPLPTTAVRVSITSSTDLDISAVVLGVDGKVRGDEDFVFYNAPEHPSGVVRTGDTLVFDLSRADAGTDRVAVLLSADDRPVPTFELHLQDGGTGVAIARYAGAPLFNETLVIAAEIYRRKGEWKFRAVGQGYADGLGGAARDFGVSVDDAPAVATPVAPVTEPVDMSNTTEQIPLTRDTGARPELDTTIVRPKKSREGRGLVAPDRATSPAQPEDAAPSVVGTESTEPQLVVRVEQLRGDSAMKRRRSSLMDAITRVAETMSGIYPRDDLARQEAALDREHAAASELLVSTRTDLRNAMYLKYGNKLQQGWETQGYYNDFASTHIGGELWVSRARGVIEKIVTSGTPLLKANREALKQELVKAAGELLRIYDNAVANMEKEFAARHQTLFEVTFSDYAKRAASSGHQVIEVWEPAARVSLPHPHHTIDPVWLSETPPKELVTGVGNLCFPVGQMSATTLTVHARVNPGRQTSKALEQVVSLSLSPDVHNIPYLLDLDECGGFVTDDRQIVQNVVLDMLALLPAGRVKIDAVDPVELGASLNFLYGLGDAGPKVFGDKVWGSHNISDLLVDLESHVAFVTQKYLQGTHDTLTSYNQEAGEVAEPYRLVLLFDHPRAFSKDGQNFDQESLTRMQRLADVGRRAGVFFLATVPKATRGTASIPSELKALASVMTGGSDSEIVKTLGLATTGPRKDPVFVSGVTWGLRPDTPPTDAQLADLLAHIERQMQAAANVQVDPAKVYTLAQAEARRAAAKGVRAELTVANPHDPSTWWASDTTTGAVSRFGRMSASNVAALQIDSNDFPAALVGGRTGSGKSVLLHSLILGWAMQYPPDELEFYLIDFKEGVEFKPYAAGELPHAKVVAIETNRDFGISVLESLDKEIERRGELFKAVGGGEVNFGTYRRQSGEKLPRTILVIDEFHMMLEEEDETSRQGAALIERVIRQGRAFGVHAVLASQSVSGSAQKIRVALDQIKTRLVLASSSKDSELLLAEGNVDAQLLSKPGEGIINTKGGLRDANNRFQCAYWSGEDREKAIASLHDLARARNFTRRPVVFEGNAEAPVTDQPEELFMRSSRVGELVLPVGAPMSLADPVCMRVPRAAGGNVLVISPDAADSIAMMTASLLASGIEVDVVDFAALTPPWDDVFKSFTAHGLRMTHARQFPSLLTELKDIVDERIDLSDFHGSARVLVLPGLQRARDLNPDDYDDEAPAKVLGSILRDGPEVGIHVLAWGDRYATVQRRFDHAALREFSHKLLGPLSEADSRTLADSAVAASLTPAQFLYDDFDTGRQSVARRFSIPEIDWLTALASRASESSSV
ncbi:FtsK/SpoIIIE domain-containing protein [Rhodococcus pyridinivorans]